MTGIDFELVAARVAECGFAPDALAFEHVASCNLCQGDSSCVIAHRDRYGFALNAVMCRRCGLVYLAPRPTAAAYMDFYGRHYRPLVSAFHGRLIDATTVQVEQLPYARTVARFLQRRLAPGAGRRLLDIGGSTGVVAQVVAAELGYTGVVLDPSPDELVHARGRGLETISGLFEDLEPAEHGTFELVLLCQTIDHLLDIDTCLRKIRAMLKSDGLFYFDILDFAMNIRRHGVRGSVKIDHPFYLTEQTAMAYLQAAGFAVVDAIIHPDGIHLGYLCAPAAPRPAQALWAAGAADTYALIRSTQVDKEWV